MHPSPTNLWLDSGLQRLNSPCRFHVFSNTIEYLSCDYGRTWPGLWVYNSIIFLVQHLYQEKCRNRLRNWTQTCHHPHMKLGSHLFTYPFLSSWILWPRFRHLGNLEEVKFEEKHSLQIEEGLSVRVENVHTSMLSSKE